MPSVHDNRVLGYDVDGERRRIVLHTVFEDGPPRELTDIVFESVVAYRFRHDIFANILFDVEEVGLRTWLNENASELVEGQGYAWPIHWVGPLEDLLGRLQLAGAKAFSISSSSGLDGWVLAGRCEVVARDGSASV